MSVIKVDLPLGEVPVMGKQVSFKAPCDCTVTEAVQIDGVNYTVCDALGRCVTGEGGVWAAGEIISVILNPEDQKAYIQNGNLVHVATGSYVGTGTSKDPGQVTLTFDFAPKILMLYGGTGRFLTGNCEYEGRPVPAIGFPQKLTTTYKNGLFHSYKADPSSDIQAKRSEDGKTITWYHPGYDVDEETEEIYYRPELGFNYGGSTYNYLAIG